MERSLIVMGKGAAVLVLSTFKTHAAIPLAHDEPIPQHPQQHKHPLNGTMMAANS